MFGSSGLPAAEIRAHLELAHHPEGGLPQTEEQSAGGHCLHQQHLLIHDAKKIDDARGPQAPRLVPLWLPPLISLQGAQMLKFGCIWSTLSTGP